MRARASRDAADKLLALRGEGTFGKVVECYDRQTRRHVAIKIIRSIKKVRRRRASAWRGVGR